ncbi:hypothetical protein F5Y12DRAFT_734071 [Xylaria sp. FL1777]|nr:hypothetical protein F5Y12DRAFT_734071 [Xylaria sp. FL1777]
MPSSPSPSPPSSAQQASHDAPNGLFRQGVWLCDCEPRLRATVRYITKSTSKHKGKRFYGCPTSGNEGNRCNMFVLIEDAQRRERESLMSNGRSEKKQKKQTTLPDSYTPRKVNQDQATRSPVREVIDLDGVSDGASPANSAPSPQDPDIYDTSSDDEVEEEVAPLTPSRTTNHTLQPSAMARTPTTRASGSKAKRPSDEEDFLDDLSTSGAEEMVAAVERSSKTTTKQGKQREAPVTPSTARTTNVENGLPTPSLTVGRSTKKPHSNIPAGGESSHSGATKAKRQRLDATEGARLFGTDATIGPMTSSSPPPPPLSSPPPTTAPAPGSDVTSEVMDLLKDENIAPATRNAVRKALDKYVNQAKGFERGRDVSRKAAKEAEDRSARLQEKVDDLERARSELRTQLMDLWHRV